MIFTHLFKCSHPSRHEAGTQMQVFAAALLVLLALIPASAQTQAANTISTVAGGGLTPTTPTLADLPGPTATIKNAAGTLFIAAPYSSYIYQLSSGSVFSVYAGFGYGGFNDDGKSPANTQLGFVGSFATDSQGNLYFADFGNSRVRMVSASTGLVTTIAGQSEKCAHNYATCGDGGPATSALLNLPMGIAVDASGNIYIADSSNNRIRKVDAISHNISTVAGATVNNVDNACTNPTLACGDGGPATSANLDFPTGVAVDAAGNIYIADSGDHRVRVVDHVTGIISRYAGDGGACIDPLNLCGDGRAADAKGTHLRGPSSIALDASGNGFIADQLDHRIRRVDAATKIITTVAGTGAQGASGDGGAATSANLNMPFGVYVDSSANIYISDTGNQRIRKVDATTGNISLVAGGGNGGDNGPATQATLAGPYSIMEDPSGNVYFTDTYNNRIRKLSNGVITTFAGTGNAGYSGDLGPATSATFDGPSSIVRDSLGNFYVADENNLVVRKIDVSGNISLYAGIPNKSCTPTTAACGDGFDRLTATFASPQTLAIDPNNNNLYIADYFAHRVRMVNASTGTVTTAAGMGNFGNAGDNGLATAAHLNHPSGIVLDNAGKLYISDQYNNRIRVVKPCVNNPSSQCIYAFALNTAAHLGGDGGPAINGSMWNPLEITIDPAQNLYVSGGNDRVVQIIDAATQYWGTVAGNSNRASSGGFTGDGGPAQSARLANAGSSVDGSGNLYIADQGNNRIRYVPLAPAITNTPKSLAFGNVMIGTTSPPKNVTTLSSGGLDLNLTSPVAITGPNAANFAMSNSCSGVTFLAPNRKCTEGITFSPTTFGKATASLTFTDNATGSPHTVALSGSGPDFSISASPSSLTVNKGSSGTSTITLVPLGGFNNPINLTISGCPTGTTCTVNPTTVNMDGTNNGTSTFKADVGSTTTSGIYPITVKGSFTPLQHPTTITLTVP